MEILGTYEIVGNGAVVDHVLSYPKRGLYLPFVKIR